MKKPVKPFNVHTVMLYLFKQSLSIFILNYTLDTDCINTEYICKVCEKKATLEEDLLLIISLKCQKPF